MANNTKFTVDIVAEQKELRKAFKELEKQRKEMVAAAKKQHKLESGLFKKRLTDEQKAQRDNFKQQEKAIKQQISANRSKERFQKKWQTAEVRFEKEQEKRRKKQERDFMRGPLGQYLQRGGMQRGARRIGGLAAAAAGGITGFLIGGAVRSYQAYLEQGRAMSGAIGLSLQGRQTRRDISRAGGGRLGFSVADAAQLTPAMGRATGVAAPRELMQAMRATALTGQEAGDLFATIRQAGFGFEGGERQGQSAGSREFQKLIAGGIFSGLERARLPEYFKGVQNIVTQQGNILAGVVDMQAYAKTFALMGRSGAPGLQGQRGANVFAKLNQAFLKPGGGEWGESFIRMAMGFGTPGGTTGFYGAEKAREEGASPENMMRLITEVQQQFGGGQEGALALREIAGVSLSQAEELLKIFNSSENVEGKLGEIDEVMQDSKSLEKQSLTAMKNIGGTLRRIAALSDRAAGQGAKVAPAVEKLEDLQFKAFAKLVSLTETLVGYVGDIWELAQKTFGERKSPEQLAERRKEIIGDAFESTSAFKKSIREDSTAKKIANVQKATAREIRATVTNENIIEQTEAARRFTTGSEKLAVAGSVFGFGSPVTPGLVAQAAKSRAKKEREKLFKQQKESAAELAITTGFTEGIRGVDPTREELEEIASRRERASRIRKRPEHELASFEELEKIGREQAEAAKETIKVMRNVEKILSDQPAPKGDARKNPKARKAE